MNKIERVRLKDVCDNESSSIAKKDLLEIGGEYPVYGASGLIKKVDFYKQDRDYIAVVKDGAGIGRTMLLPAKSSVIGTMQYILPKDNVNISYLYYAITSMQLSKYFTGATIPHIYFKDYQREELPLPSLEMQKQIADELDKITELIEKRKQQIEKLDMLLKIQFMNTVANNAEDYELWEKQKIQNLCAKHRGSMRTGPFGSSLLHSEFVEEGVFVLGIDNAVENKFSYNKMRYITEEKYEKLKRYTVFPEDVIITIMGTVGRSAVVPNEIGRAINTKHLACLTVDKSIILPLFLSYCIQSHPYILQQIKKSSKGAIMDGLNLTLIKSLELPLPPIEEQEKFIKYLGQSSDLKSSMLKELEQLEILYKERMQKYFR